MNSALAARATGALREFNAAGVLAPADVHVAQRLAAIALEDDEQVMLAVAFALLREMSDRMVRSEADIPESLGVPILGTLGRRGKRGWNRQRSLTAQGA